MKLYVMFDNVAAKAGPVFEQDTNESAKRAVSSVKFPPGTKANDYNLICVGEKSLDGSIFSHGMYTLVCTLPAEDVAL